MPLFLRTILH